MEVFLFFGLAQAYYESRRRWIFGGTGLTTRGCAILGVDGSNSHRCDTTPSQQPQSPLSLAGVGVSTVNQTTTTKMGDYRERLLFSKPPIVGYGSNDFAGVAATTAVDGSPKWSVDDDAMPMAFFDPVTGEFEDSVQARVRSRLMVNFGNPYKEKRADSLIPGKYISQAPSTGRVLPETGSGSPPHESSFDSVEEGEAVFVIKSPTRTSPQRDDVDSDFTEPPPSKKQRTAESTSTSTQPTDADEKPPPPPTGNSGTTSESPGAQPSRPPPPKPPSTGIQPPPKPAVPIQPPPSGSPGLAPLPKQSGVGQSSSASAGIPPPPKPPPATPPATPPPTSPSTTPPPPKPPPGGLAAKPSKPGSKLAMPPPPPSGKHTTGAPPRPAGVNRSSSTSVKRPAPPKSQVQGSARPPPPPPKPSTVGAGAAPTSVAKALTSEAPSNQDLQRSGVKPQVDLPAGWMCVWSKSQKRWYFFNTKNNRSVWQWPPPKL